MAKNKNLKKKTEDTENRTQNDVRTTLIMNETVLRDIKALAWYERTKLKDIIHEACKDFLNNKQRQATLKKALKMYK